jgi:4'-phosphopantetheinyl transferase EntD
VTGTGGLFAGLLAGPVRVADIVGLDAEARLLPAEEHLIAKSVESRRREVTYARSCARRALAELGRPPVAIPRGPKGEPGWPAGVVGSLTHTKGYYAAAVAEAAAVRSLGIDAEQHDVLPDGVLAHIAFGPEPDMVAALGSGLHYDRILFSAKESVYKTWFPLTGRWLGFEDAELALDPDGTFTARILIDGATTDGGPPLTALSGRYAVRDGFVLTAITLPPA